MTKLAEMQGIIRIWVEISAMMPASLDKRLVIINKERLLKIEAPPPLQNEPQSGSTGGKSSAMCWDIGFAKAPRSVFYEINAITRERVTRDSYLQSYQDLLSQLQKAAVDDYRDLLGVMGTDNEEKDGDILITRDRMLNSLSKHGIDVNNDGIKYLLRSAWRQGRFNVLCSIRNLQQKFQYAVEAAAGQHIQFVRK